MISPTAKALLAHARKHGGTFVYGAGQVAAARALETRGLASLEDCGKLRGDRERWWLTPAPTAKNTHSKKSARCV